MSYEEYYQHCVKACDFKYEGCTIDVTKFQLHVLESDGNYPDNFKDYIENCIKLGNYNDFTSLKSVELDKSDKDMMQLLVNVIDYGSLLCLEDKVSSDCWMDLHRLYLYQNKPIEDDIEADNINYNQYHWKNEPKTIITLYIYLDDVTEDDSHISVLHHPTANKCISMPTTRTGIDNWGPNTNPRYHNCTLSDSQVEEMKYYGFEEKHITGKKGTCIMLGNNVIHKHNIKTSNNMLVMKFRPTVEVNVFNFGGVFDLPIDPSPY